jgi:hypothetical protein
MTQRGTVNLDMVLVRKLQAKAAEINRDQPRMITTHPTLAGGKGGVTASSLATYLITLGLYDMDDVEEGK